MMSLISDKWDENKGLYILKLKSSNETLKM